MTSRLDPFIDYRSCADLDRCVIDSLHKAPSEVDAIVGIPRSGMLVAAILALHLDLPMADLDSFLDGRFLTPGDRAKDGRRPAEHGVRHVLVVDDDVRTGRELARVRRRLAEANLDCQYTLAVAYASPGEADNADLVFEWTHRKQRLFEWKMMNNPLLPTVCFDMDGVLCRDPSPEEDDDGAEYQRFLDMAEPRFRPARKLGWIITARSEKYRQPTEQWLARNNIEYGELVMMDVPDKEARAKVSHAAYKAEIYNLKPSWLFIESCPFQALNISRWSGKPVYCVGDTRMYFPKEVHVARAKTRRTLTSFRERLKGSAVQCANALLRKLI